MKIELQLSVSDKDAKNFYNAILPDFTKKGRSDVDVLLSKDKIIFTIKSEDFTSVRASINSVLLKLRALNELGTNIKSK